MPQEIILKSKMSLRVLYRFKTIRNLMSTLACSSTKSKDGDFHFDRINSWQIHSYGGLDELQCTRARAPVIRDPNDVLVKVLAASINPLDIAMMNGYGSILLNFMRQAKSCSFEKQLEFPLTLGRDFAGILIAKGHSTCKGFEIGDEVWGVVPPYSQGSHAEKVMVSSSLIRKKPSNLTMVEAGSMLYAAITAWSALKITGDLAILGAKGKTALILGGSGGVGTMAVQMLRNWGAQVTATCSEDAIPLVKSLGIDDVVNYKAQDALEQIGTRKYDIILDCAGIGSEEGAKYCQYLKEYNISKFITLKSPMLKNVDEYGLLCGMMKNMGDLIYQNVTSGCLPKSSSVRWGFFIPLEQALTEITQDVEEGKILPCIQNTYSFEEVPKAYEHASQGHLRGKIVIDMTKKSTQSVAN